MKNFIAVFGILFLMGCTPQAIPTGVSTPPATILNSYSFQVTGTSIDRISYQIGKNATAYLGNWSGNGYSSIIQNPWIFYFQGKPGDSFSIGVYGSSDLKLTVINETDLKETSGTAYKNASNNFQIVMNGNLN